MPPVALKQASFPVERLDSPPPRASSELWRLVQADASLPAFAQETCALLAGLAGLDAAALLFCTDEGEVVQILGAHGVLHGDLSAMVRRREVGVLVRRALVQNAVAESPEGTFVAVPAPAGAGLAVVVVGRRDAAADAGPACPNELLLAPVRIAGLALRDRAALLETERARRDRARTDLARAIHDDVIQRMFGVTLALDGEGALDEELRGLCADGVQASLTDLREILRRSLHETDAPPTMPGLDQDLAALTELDVDVVHGPGELSLTGAQDAIARSVLAEAMRNARKHADPGAVRVEVDVRDGLLQMTVENDGVGRSRRTGGSPGIGLQIAATEALQGGGFVEHGPMGSGGWRVHLTLPTAEVPA